MKPLNFNPFPADENGQTVMDDIVGEPLTKEQIDKLQRQHSHRIPSADDAKTLAAIRQIFYKAALFLDTYLPPSRERSLAQTNLDQARMWACSAATLDGEIKEKVE